jgi:hypothetical protein
MKIHDLIDAISKVDKGTGKLADIDLTFKLSGRDEFRILGVVVTDDKIELY